ncbi:hypothetical protein EUGRSUZ_E02596 [Eucalyptus grandis]|uniref:Disease resistance protein RPS4B/Roq1-like leucine-rich repeats domain-containing protein n=2 Tax=Eucalyptus grandis TaxID=71139 RepID=A0A059C6A8_EUCGR|nr:hypothetical protein EUGRSUZ_E02596 [Eucalyptus grandis]
MFLDNCKNLVSLPSSIYKLQNLEDLALRGCTNFTWFPKYEDSANPCSEIGLPNLRSLRLEGCKLSEVQFLENLSCFPFLRQLRLTGNNITSLPTTLNKRAHLSHLIVEHCHQLQEIPKLPPSFSYLYAEGCESLKNNGDLTSLHHFVRRGLTMADTYSSGEMPHDFNIILSGGEMPKWVFPIEEGSISFMASKDLYDKFLALALCFVLCNDELKEETLVVSHVNGKRLDHSVHTSYTSDSDPISLEYLIPCDPWGEVDFSQIDGSLVQFSSKVSSTRVKKWGLRILCKSLEDHLKVILQDNQLMDPALLYEVCYESTELEAESSLMHEDSSMEIDLHKDSQDCQMSTNDLKVDFRDKQLIDLASLYEVGHESTNSIAESSLMHEDNLSEADLHEDLQDCQVSGEEQSQIVPKENPELFSLEACKPRPWGLLIRLTEMCMAVFARCFCC